MNPELTLTKVDAQPTRPAPTFAVRYSLEVPAYQELTLEDASGVLAHWVIPQPIKQLAKRPGLLWLLSTMTPPDSLSCLETGPLQLAAAEPGTDSNLRAELAQGMVRLAFSGQLLRGYYRLHCLPTGCGQLWQFTPISRV